MKKLILMAFVCCVATVQAALVEIKTSDEFREYIKAAPVPVVVQFSAYWCGPCQELKATMKQVANGYIDSQVRLVYIDAYVNSDLKSYLQGGYPTVRTFSGGQLENASFVGTKSASEVKRFIDGVIANDSDFRFESEVGASCSVDVE